MNVRRTVRLFVLALVAASLGACHFHGGHGHCHSWGFTHYVPRDHYHCR
ncbi:MAG: hypothetical protein WAT39_02150 [Planctomycetota bacterium]